MEENKELLEKENNIFKYEGLDIARPERFEGESYHQYKVRRKVLNRVLKQRLKGFVIHQSRQHIYDKREEDGGKFLGLGKGLTYVKPKE